mmetsp:Transcript_15716/g.24134  ORF Transcript_15716/g.24134 Transcript_15716/m.24134 type:complete len:214 (-) Transcript_15716:3-644(-)
MILTDTISQSRLLDEFSVTHLISLFSGSRLNVSKSTSANSIWLSRRSSRYHTILIVRVAVRLLVRSRLPILRLGVPIIWMLLGLRILDGCFRALELLGRLGSWVRLLLLLLLLLLGVLLLLLSLLGMLLLLLLLLVLLLLLLLLLSVLGLLRLLSVLGSLVLLLLSSRLLSSVLLLLGVGLLVCLLLLPIILLLVLGSGLMRLRITIDLTHIC